MPRALVIALAAVPVLALVYLRQLRHGRVAARVGLVAGAGAIVVAGLAPFAAPVTSARPPIDRPAYGGDQFAPVARAPIAGASITPSDAPARLSIRAPENDEAAAAARGPAVAHELVRAATEAPSVVRFRPRDSWKEVARGALLSVRFTVPMDRTVTAAAFHASVRGTEIAGRTRWAEGDTVLVLDPRALLPAGAKVILRVDASALSAAGLPLDRPASATFTVVRPTPTATVARTATSSSKPPSTTTSGGWIWPLVGRITQRFGESLTQYGTHYGIDIDGDTGDPVRAARAGSVTVAGYADECGGIQVRIDHGDGFVSWYRHLSAELVAVGQAVARGSTIGRVGSTGCSTGSHLHFAITRDGSWVDPERYLPRRI